MHHSHRELRELRRHPGGWRGRSKPGLRNPSKPMFLGPKKGPRSPLTGSLGKPSRPNPAAPPSRAPPEFRGTSAESDAFRPDGGLHIEGHSVHRGGSLDFPRTGVRAPIAGDKKPLKPWYFDLERPLILKGGANRDVWSGGGNPPSPFPKNSNSQAFGKFPNPVAKPAIHRLIPIDKT